MLTDDQLQRIMPNLKAEKRAAYVPHLLAAMEEFSVNNHARAAAFLAQLAHESGEFRWMEEIWGPTSAQRRYEPPTRLARNLGNTQPGDGKRFKGRGPIQLTGRANYETFGGLLNIDLAANPELAATPAVAFRVAGLYWHRRGLNDLADKQWFKTITKRINGGFNGLADRIKYYERAKSVLGVGIRRGMGEPDTDDEPPSFTRGLDTENEPVPIASERNAYDPGEADTSAPPAAESPASVQNTAAPTLKAAQASAKKSAAKKAPTTKPLATTPGAKQTSAKTASTKTASAKKTSKKKVSAKSSTAKPSAAKKSAGKSSSAKKPAANKASAKKTAAKKSVARAAAKKGGAKKSAS